MRLADLIWALTATMCVGVGVHDALALRRDRKHIRERNHPMRSHSSRDGSRSDGGSRLFLLERGDRPGNVGPSLSDISQRVPWAETSRDHDHPTSHHDTVRKPTELYSRSHQTSLGKHHHSHHRHHQHPKHHKTFDTSLNQINSQAIQNSRGYEPLGTSLTSEAHRLGSSKMHILNSPSRSQTHVSKSHSLSKTDISKSPSSSKRHISKYPSSSKIHSSKASKKSTSKKSSRYPYSTTFQSFDSFLNSMGSSFTLAGDPHAIRPRSDSARNSIGQEHETLGAVRDSYLNDQPSSQDLQETNALGIDVLERDRETLLKMPERCCGSKVPLDPDNAQATGGFSRVASAGSIKVIEVPEKDTDILPPAGVRDLKISVTGPRSIMLTWSAPGDDLDSGKASRYVVRISDTRYDLRERRFDQVTSYTQLDLDDVFQTSGVFQEAGTMVKVKFNVDHVIPTSLRAGQQYYLAFRAVDDFNNTSPVSNVATFTLPVLGSKPTRKYLTTTKRPTTTTRRSTTTTTTTPPPQTTFRTTTTTTPLPALPPTIEPSISSPAPSIVPEEDRNQNQISATLIGRVIPSYPTTDEPQQKRKERKRKGKGRKNRRKNSRKGKKNKINRKEDTTVTPYRPTPSTFDSFYSTTPGCLSDNGEQITDAKLCDAISALLTVVEYFENTREYTHLDYLSSIVATLKNRAQPHWSTSLAKHDYGVVSK